MTTLTPTRYAGTSNSTFFEAGGLLITLSYTVVQRKRWLVLPGSLEARLEANVASRATVSRAYEIPRDRSVGPEITAVERGLYAFVDEVVRAAVQLEALEATERAVSALEEEHLFESLPRESAGVGEAGKPPRFVESLVDRTLMAVRHLTNVTSLTQDGLEAYQSDRSEAMASIWRASSFGSALRVHGVLQAVEAFVRHEAESTDDLKQLRLRTREHLKALREGQVELREALTPERVEIIVADAVPEFLSLKRRYDQVARVPRNLVEHVVGSFFLGGFGGFLAIDVFGESILSSLIGGPVDLPGFAIGAAVTFAWPYLRGGYGWFIRERWLERRRGSLMRKLGRQLDLALPPGETRLNAARD